MTRELAMMTPDSGGRGLDPAHIIGVCWSPAGVPGHYQHTQAVRTTGGFRVTVPSRRGANEAAAALTRVGYLVTRSPGERPGRGLLVTGWSPAGLESRLAAMRAVVHQLAGSPSVTAQAVIEAFRGQPAASPAPWQILQHADRRLHAWAYARTGPSVPHDSAVVPGDVRNALRLRVAWQLEQTVDDLIDRHLRVARHALALFIPLSQALDGSDAQQTAIRQAGITFHLPGDVAQNTSALLQGPPTVSGPASAPSRPPSRPRPAPGQLAAREFPARPLTTGTAFSVPEPTASPGGRHFPAARPGRRH
jgi:hypothetical protein